MIYTNLEIPIIGVTWRSLGTNPASTAARVAPTKQKQRKNHQIILILLRERERERERNRVIFTTIAYAYRSKMQE
jgi:inosine/xanthosine triphosphate pyrophosphatase family protein